MNYTMNFSDYRFTLDIQLHQAQVSIPVTFEDSARRLCISLTDGRKPYIIGEGCRAVFNARKSDNTKIKNDCIIENNTVIYEFTPNTTNCEGVVHCDITIYDINGRVLSSPQFIIVVDKKVVRDDEITLASEDETTILKNIISDELKRVEAETGRNASEGWRNENESWRRYYEDERQAAEGARNKAETARVEAENARAEVENARAEAEAEREAIIGDIGSALDSILAIQEYLMGKRTFTLNIYGNIHTLDFEEGMTWGDWIVSEYNTVAIADNGGEVYLDGVSVVRDSTNLNRTLSTTDIIYENGAYIVT